MRLKGYLKEQRDRSGQTNLSEPNVYYVVTKPFDINILVGHKKSNTWYGAANLLQPLWKAMKTRKGDEIHYLHGGLFFVRGGQGHTMRVGKQPPRFAPLERGSRYDKFPLGNIQ